MMNKINELRTQGASENQLSGLKRVYQAKDGASFARELGNFGVEFIDTMINGTRSSKVMSALGGAMQGGTSQEHTNHFFVRSIYSLIV